MGAIGLTNGSRSRQALGYRRLWLMEGRVQLWCCFLGHRSRRLKLPCWGRGWARVVVVAEEPETCLSVKLLALGFHFRRGLSTFCWLRTNLKILRKKWLELKEAFLVLSRGYVVRPGEKPYDSWWLVIVFECKLKFPLVKAWPRL